MEHISTTPFGRRPLSLGMVAATATVKRCAADAIAEKWKVLDNLRQAKEAVGVSDRALSVLNALLTFHQDTTLSVASSLIVFPSNKALSHRANGMSPATLRRNLAGLVHAGLIIRRDSPNGKRYARKGEGGQIEQAYGFDLSPLVARAQEFDDAASHSRAIEKANYLLREEISLLRRDISKTIAMALEERIAGPWATFASEYGGLGAMPARRADVALLEGVVSELRRLWNEIEACLAEHIETTNMSASESHTERHHQSSKTYPNLESESGNQVKKEEPLAPLSQSLRSVPKAYPLSLVMQACPDIAMYTRGGEGISSWREFYAAAGVVRSTLGISPSAWSEACQAMGEENACVMVAAILQRAESIRSPGAYLRSLTDRVKAGQFSLGPVLMALLRAALSKERKRA